jgi:hypothetical protein
MRLELINLFKVAVIVGVGSGLGAAIALLQMGVLLAKYCTK